MFIFSSLKGHLKIFSKLRNSSTYLVEDLPSLAFNISDILGNNTEIKKIAYILNSNDEISPNSLSLAQLYKKLNDNETAIKLMLSAICLPIAILSFILLPISSVVLSFIAASLIGNIFFTPGLIVITRTYHEPKNIMSSAIKLSTPLNNISPTIDNDNYIATQSNPPSLKLTLKPMTVITQSPDSPTSSSLSSNSNTPSDATQRPLTPTAVATSPRPPINTAHNDNVIHHTLVPKTDYSRNTL